LVLRVYFAINKVVAYGLPADWNKRPLRSIYSPTDR
jgi:hypothetical protein